MAPRAFSKNFDSEAGMSGSSESLDGIRETIDELATRYELGEGAPDALHELVRMVDWGQGNFVPKSTDSEEELLAAKHQARRKTGRPQREIKSSRPTRDRGRAPRVASSLLAESLTGLELEPVRAAGRMADIGSGAGFPGLTLAIALPETRVALLENVAEKCDFLRRAVEELELDNVEVVEGPAQEWSEGAGKCDVVTSRKAGRPKTIIEWSAPLLAPGGAIVVWPGSTDLKREVLEEAAGAAEAAGLRLAEPHSWTSKNRKGKTLTKHLYMYEKSAQG
jgi:16S rRNA (guanine(527)-N(7))-methyltransferase RsmG